jgi:hypothetical protein
MVDFVSELKYTKSLSGLEAMIGADSDVTIKLVGSNNEQYPGDYRQVLSVRR